MTTTEVAEATNESVEVMVCLPALKEEMDDWVDRLSRFTKCYIDWGYGDDRMVHVFTTDDANRVRRAILEISGDLWAQHKRIVL
jgi:hypothetical protein